MMDSSSFVNGKTVLITGATDGIGKITALELARMGARVVIVGRDPEKTAQVVAELQKQAGNQQVESLLADLSSRQQVNHLADEFLAKYQRLDVLINNAGAVFFERKVSVDGIEMTWALNHFNYFILTMRLLDLIKASAPARIVNVSSGAHIGAKLDLANPFSEKSWSSWEAYSQTKLANLYFTYELARRLDGSGVTANALHPGFVASNFGKSNGGIYRPLFKLIHVIGAISPEKGAETPVYLASSPEVEGISGQYFDRKKAVRSSAVSYDRAVAERLWEASIKVSGILVGATEVSHSK